MHISDLERTAAPCLPLVCLPTACWLQVKCTCNLKLPEGSTIHGATQHSRLSLAFFCADCQAGFGRDPSVSGSNDMQCSLCPRGTYSEGTLTTNSEGYDAKCQPCPTHDYTYQHVDKVSEWDEPLRGPFNSYSTSLVPGAVTEDHCLPIFHQLVRSMVVWQSPLGASTLVVQD